MKLKFLFIVFFGLTNFVHAQGIKATFPGYAYDNFDLTTDYIDENGLGIFLLPDTINFTVPYYKRVNNLATLQSDGIYKSIKERKGDGKVSYTVSQPYGLFEPHVKVRFGKDKGINLNSNLYLQVGIKMNLASMPNEGVRIKFSLIDKNKNKIDSKGINGGKTSQFADGIYVIISKTGVFTKGLNLPNDLFKFNTTSDSVTFITVNFGSKANNTLGYEAVYPELSSDEYINNQKCVADIRGDEGIINASKPNREFNPDSVNGFNLIFLSNYLVVNDCYYNQTLTDLKFDLTSFGLSTENDIITLLEENEVSKIIDLIAYPNPVKDGHLNLNQITENVKVYDAIGNIVFSANSASKISIDGFAKGLYVLQSTKGSTRFVVE